MLPDAHKTWRVASAPDKNHLLFRRAAVTVWLSRDSKAASPPGLKSLPVPAGPEPENHTPQP